MSSAPMVNIKQCYNGSTAFLYINSENINVLRYKIIKKSTVFEHIMNLEDFKRVYLDDCKCVSWDIDPNVDSNIVWDNKIDWCSDSCYIYSEPAKETKTA